MSRCIACDRILTSAEMYTREIIEDDVVIEVVEDMCTKCRKIVMDDYEEDLGDMFLDYMEEDDYYEEY